MRLKQLKVFGFKTFAEPLKLDFEPGITAIVGPNGSGKSNLVDAIRWALGEQSSKQLRSGRTDDVIFAGNTKRKPLGMAEVSLLFDNSDHRLPIEFAEVEITRRAYRAGEIEYYINRNHVRLRDVMDLLMGTGLGPGSYAIVSQGQIDAILSSKPTERRALFEETAGIARFLARKNEALRRLEHTEQNAIRISDLIAELGRRIPELDTQVRRAKRYRKVSARVRDLELLSYMRASKSRREERERVRAALGLFDERQAGAAAKASALAAELSSVRTALYKQELALEECRVAAQEARAQLAELQAGFAATRGRRDALEAQSSTRVADEERSRGERSELDETLERLGARIAPLLVQVDEARAIEARITASLAAARASLDAAFTALRAFQTALAEKMASAAERRAMVQSAEREIARIGDELERIREERTQAEREAAQSRARFDTGERELAELEARVAARAAEIAALDAQLAAGASQLEALQQRVRGLHAEVSSDDARLHTLEELENSLEGHVPGTRAVIDAAARGELRGVRGVVSQLLRVDERYARALDNAFGPRLSNIVTETSEDAERAIAFLTERELGRATFLPLDTLRSRKGHELGALAGREGIVGYAHTLVTTQPEYAGIVAFLVGRVLVVERLALGIQLVRRESFRDEIVTLAGEQIYGGGAITGGRYRRERSILARRAQADALRAKLPHKRTELETLERELRAATAAAEKTTAERERVRQAHAEALVATTDARTRLGALESEIERLDGDAGDARERERVLQGQIDETRARAHALERVGELDLDESGERDRLEAELAAARERVAAVEAEQREAAHALARSRDEATTAQAERDAAQARLGMLDVDALRAAEAREATLREIAALREQHAKQEWEIGELERAVAAADEGFAAARTERERLADRANALDGEQRIALNEERRVAADGEESRTRLAQIDAELGMLTAQFAQNPATDDELADVETRYAGEGDEILEELPRLREELARLAANVNLSAESDREEIATREAFLREQLDDLGRARETLLATIREIEASTQVEFNATFERVSAAFAEMFKRLFPGGEARMWQTNPEQLSETGIEIAVQPPGKKMMALQALSGGERAMTAAALIFALIATKPSPFYLLDEVDAALDEANIDRFSTMVREVARDAQMVIVTHNKRTMELADRMYGVTMAEAGVSSIVSVALDEAPAAAGIPPRRESAIA
ncbi:MAG: chromosome segregation protein SMC [Candidatus Eremiobacteraeota bacterium]|nr:chromosome segregation protein SMC [Candidatus Eremiobacteraeota bacterium]